MTLPSGPSSFSRAEDVARLVVEASERAAAFLLSNQDEDGFWRDYRLPPGRSEAWATAVVGLALSEAAPRIDGIEGACSRAVTALNAARTPDGWGYNRNTAADADTTSWVTCFLRARGVTDLDHCRRVLLRHVSRSGHARTFLDPRFGHWAAEHEDVTPLVGLALQACGCEPEVLSALERAAAGSALEHQGWKGFWWQNESYALAWNLEWLAARRALSDEVREIARAQLAHLPSTTSFLDAACRLRAEIHLFDATLAESEIARSIVANRGALQESRELLVPPQHGAFAKHALVPYPDDRGLMTTACALLALTSWSRRTRRTLA